MRIGVTPPGDHEIRGVIAVCDRRRDLARTDGDARLLAHEISLGAIRRDRAGGTLRTLGTLGPLQSLRSLQPLNALWTIRADRARIAFCAARAFRTRGTNTGRTLGAHRTERTCRARGAGRTLETCRFATCEKLGRDCLGVDGPTLLELAELCGVLAELRGMLVDPFVGGGDLASAARRGRKQREHEGREVHDLILSKRVGGDARAAGFLPPQIEPCTTDGMTDEKVIELVDVKLDHPRGGTPLVSDGDLGVARGEVVVIVGAAGVGTSRLVAAMMGEVPPSAGAIHLLGRDVTKLRRSSLRLLRRNVGVVPQDLCLFEDRSAQLNVVLPLEIDGVPRTVSVPRAAEVLAAMGLEDEAGLPVDCLSASARQRVAVARALVRAPELVLADHPTSAQDALGAERVCEAFYEASSQGAAVLVFTRDPALRHIADRNRWRQLALLEGRLRPLGEIELDGRSIEDVLVGIESAPIVALPDPSIPNVLPFPITARTAGAR